MKIKLSLYAKQNGVYVITLWRRIKKGTLDIEKSNE